ncbi:hypothetical protein JCM9957A_56730 [Kineosporia succinea]
MLVLGREGGCDDGDLEFAVGSVSDDRVGLVAPGRRGEGSVKWRPVSVIAYNMNGWGVILRSGVACV